MNKAIKKATGNVALVNPDNPNFKAKTKKVVVCLACYGVIPIALADWLLRMGGLAHE